MTFIRVSSYFFWGSVVVTKSLFVFLFSLSHSLLAWSDCGSLNPMSDAGEFVASSCSAENLHKRKNVRKDPVAQVTSPGASVASATKPRVVTVEFEPHDRVKNSQTLSPALARAIKEHSREPAGTTAFFSSDEAEPTIVSH